MTTSSSFGSVGTSARTASQPSSRPVRLTERGVSVTAVLVGVVLFGACWLASAVGYWLTGVAG